MVAIENYFSIFTVLYGTWTEYTSSPAAWLGLLLAAFSIFTVEIIMRNILGHIMARIRKENFDGGRFLML